MNFKILPIFILLCSSAFGQWITNSKFPVCPGSSTTTNGYVMTYILAQKCYGPAAAPGSGGGEANTASSLGGASIFGSKVGVDLRFKGLLAGSSKLTVTPNANGLTLDLDIVPANITISQLSGYVDPTNASNITSGTINAARLPSITAAGLSAQYIDWSAVSGGTSIANKPTSMTPTAHATSHKNGGTDEVATATAAANAIPKAGSDGKLAVGWIPDLSTAYQPLAAALTTIAAMSNTNNIIMINTGTGWITTAVPDCPSGTINYTAATHSFGCGAGPGGVSAPLSLTGSTDAVQLLVKGNGTQTNSIFKVTKSDDTILFQVNNDGSIDMGAGTGGWQLTAETAPATPSTGKGVAYLDSTSKAFALKNDAGIVSHTIQDFTCSGQFARSLAATGVITCQAVSLTGDVSGILPVANGGTNNAFFTVTGPASTPKSYAFPNANATMSYTVASGTATLGTSSIAANGCATAVTVSATGVATTDVIKAGFNADVSAVTGYGAATTDGLVIYPYPTANNVNFKVCNTTGSSITPGAATLNWSVVR